MALGPGSIAFVGYNADGPDNLAFVALGPIVAGTVIVFTDKEWNGSAFNTGESTWTWTATGEIAAGTVVTMDGLAAGQTAASNLGTIAFSDATQRDVAITNETVYAYVGEASAPVFLAAIGNDAFSSANGLLTNTGLVQGQTAISLTSLDADADIAVYAGIRGAASFDALLPMINNPANWIAQDGSGLNENDGTAPDVPFSTAPFVGEPNFQTVSFAAGSLTVSQAEGDNGETLFTFTVERSGGITGTINFSGSIGVGGVTGADEGHPITGSDGIDYQSHKGGLVHHYTGGLIDGSAHAVTAKNVALTLVNDAGATIIGRSGSAFNIDNDASAANTAHVTNRGMLLGDVNIYEDDSDGDAVDVDGLLQLDNYGQIKGLGHNGYHDGEPNISEGVAAGGGAINNYAGATIYGYGRAIQVDNSENGPAFSAIAIYNEGLIRGDGNAPIGVDPEDLMPFTPTGNEAIKIVGTFADTITNTSTGQIIGGVSLGGGDDTLINRGTMIATGGSAIDLGDGNDQLLLDAGSAVAGAILMGDGNDTVLAIGNAASVTGGLGDDTFLISNATVVARENAGEGFDKVLAGANYTLAAGSEIEWLQANSGAVGLTLTGNELANALVGGDGVDTVNGGGGNDSFNGLGGADNLNGGAGDDTYYVDSADVVTEQVGEGFDKVLALSDHTLAAGSEVEWLEARAGSTGLTLTGNELANALLGGDGADTLNGGGGNDIFNGLGGADNLNGGEGDDLYYAESNDTVTEVAGQGFDKVVAIADFTLAAGSEVEWLEASTSGLTLTGNELANALLGSEGTDTLSGGGGNDTFNGLGGADSLNGGTGDDIYYVDSADTVTEQAGQGFDKVIATANHTLAAGSEVEWLEAGADTGLTLTGNNLANAVLGGAGADTLNGGAGADQLFGGAGSDSFAFNFGHANGDRVVDFAAGDHLDFYGYGAGATLAQIGATDSYLITPDGGGAAEVVHLTNVFGLNTSDYLFH